MSKFLNESGLAYFYRKIKSYIDGKNWVTEQQLNDAIQQAISDSLRQKY